MPIQGQGLETCCYKINVKASLRILLLKIADRQVSQFPTM